MNKKTILLGITVLLILAIPVVITTKTHSYPQTPRVTQKQLWQEAGVTEYYSCLPNYKESTIALRKTHQNEIYVAARAMETYQGDQTSPAFKNMKSTYDRLVAQYDTCTLRPVEDL